MLKNIFIVAGIMMSSQLLLAQNSFHYPILEVKNEEKINSPVLEFSPSFYEDGILFISTMSAGKDKQGYDKKIKKPTMSIFFAKRNDITGSLEHPVPFAPELGSKMHEGPLTFDRNAEKVYFTRNDLKKRRKKTAKLKIYESIKNKEGVWSLPVELPFNLDDFDTAHPSISADGNTLIFSSNREGGFGGMDLYMAKQEGGIWSEPINLGDKINTPSNDVFPFLHADKTMYFSSDGRDGVGGLDLYYTVLNEKEAYVDPVSLGPDFNSPMDDLGIILDRDKKNGYFSSNRIEGMGEDDIYAFSFDQGDIDEYFYFKGLVPDVLEAVIFNVTDKTTNAPISNMNITILPLNDPIVDTSMLSRNSKGQIALLAQTGSQNNYEVLQGKMNRKGREVMTDSTGQVRILLPKGYYTVVANKTNFANQFEVVNTTSREVYFYTNEAMGCTPVYGKVIDERSQSGIPDLMVKMYDSQDQLITSVKTNDNGEFEACAKCERNYYFQVEMSGAEIGRSDLDTKNTPCEKANSYKIMIPIGDISVAMEEGTIIELKNLYFNFNDDAIRRNARQDLDNLVKVLNKYPDMEIEIASYTDAVGSEDYNQGISQKRADKVVSYLVSKGIGAERLIGIGYGESGIRNRCTNGVKCSDREHQFNRRIEIKVTKTSVPVKVTYSDATPPPEPYKAHSNKSYPGTSEDAAEYQSFHVVLGAYLMSRNAEKKANKIREMGFEETSVTTFSNSPAYHSVVVQTFYNYDEALEFAKSLKADYDLEYYIKKMR